MLIVALQKPLDPGEENLPLSLLSATPEGSFFIADCERRNGRMNFFWGGWRAAARVVNLGGTSSSHVPFSRRSRLCIPQTAAAPPEALLEIVLAGFIRVDSPYSWFKDIRAGWARRDGNEAVAG